MPDPATKHGFASFFAKGRFLESISRNSNRNQEAPSHEWPVDVNDPNHSPMAAAAHLQEQLGHEDAMLIVPAVNANLSQHGATKIAAKR
jgi:hypothetical protein